MIGFLGPGGTVHCIHALCALPKNLVKNLVNILECLQSLDASGCPETSIPTKEKLCRYSEMMSEAVTCLITAAAFAEVVLGGLKGFDMVSENSSDKLTESVYKIG